MIGLDAPLWLAALAGVPLIRWLHRRGTSGATMTVPALFPWTAAPVDAGGSARTDIDPLWRLRAVVFTILVLSSCQPWMARESSQIVVWLDDSLSMSTLEAQGPRALIALDAARNALGDRSAQWRSLSTHTQLIGSEGNAAPTDLHPMASRERRLAAPASLDTRVAHWLVTDGADPIANALAGSGQFTRVLLVGTETENAAITHIGLRRSLRDPGRTEGLVRVANAGHEAATREVSVRSGANVLTRASINIPAGEMVEVPFAVDVNATLVTATLSPADALSLDDTLSVDATSLQPMAFSMTGYCDERLQRAMATHRGIRPSRAHEPLSLTIICGPATGFNPARLSLPSVYFTNSGFSERTSGLAAWSDEARSTSRFVHTGFSATSVDLTAHTLLQDAASGAALVTRANGVIGVHVDMATAPLTDEAYLNLVATLLDNAAGRDLLDPMPVRARPRAESRIATFEHTVLTRALAPTGPAVTHLTALLLVLALPLIGADLLLSHRVHATRV